MRSSVIGAALATLAFASSAPAQTAKESPICTDRPTKANAVCTVAVGKWQLESSAVSWSRTQAGGDETKVLTLGSSVLKVGLSERSDLQIGMTPYARTRSQSGHTRSRVAGLGDVTVRYKRRLTADGAPVQIGVIPFVKLPTADSDIGNGEVEGGLAMPISIATGGVVTVVLGPELDLLADADGNGHHAALVNVVNLSATVADRLTLYGELWTMSNFDPDRTITSASADTALAYTVTDDLQLDLGANFGLNRNTPDIELYVGFAVRL